mgnify:CR=1 FL=1
MKNQEIIRYLITGVLTTVISMGTYFICTRLFHLEEMLSNTISWIFAVAFAFVTNKLFVFESKTWNKETFTKELPSFVGGRLFSLLIDEAVMYIGIRLLHINDIYVQLAKQVIVTVLNYIFGKLVFRKR